MAAIAFTKSSMAHGRDDSDLPRRDFPADSLRAETNGFDDFSREHYQALMQFLRRRVRCEEDAKDAAQETLMRLLRYRHTEPESSWKPLLYRIATNVVSEQFRRAGARHASQHVPYDDLDLASDAPAQDEMIDQQQREAWLRAAILALPPRCRQVYLLSRMQGMSYIQISNHCGICVKTVEKHISQALAALCHRAGVRGQDAT